MARRAEFRDVELTVTKMPVRYEVLDRVRGLAVLLMVLDHLAVLALVAGERWGGSIEAVRYTVTRASLPLFMVCTGALVRAKGRPSLRRLYGVGVAAVGCTLLLTAVPFGVAQPEILTVWLLAMLCVPVMRVWPVAVVCVGVVQMSAWPIAWDGYQPGMVAALMAAGFMGGIPALGWGWRLPEVLETVGRRPLAWYCGHLVVLAATAELVVL